ncbi:hypothetical protein SRO_4332 [Streptomyces rochei]|nr:hypothetical protein SRO_4332 [Streptomyces rochei]
MTSSAAAAAPTISAVFFLLPPPWGGKGRRGGAGRAGVRRLRREAVTGLGLLPVGARLLGMLRVPVGAGGPGAP